MTKTEIKKANSDEYLVITGCSYRGGDRFFQIMNSNTREFIHKNETQLKEMISQGINILHSNFYLGML